MRLNELAPAPGSKSPRKRVGRGDGSGHGSYSGKGMKGQKSRAGAYIRRGFEGGQLPLIKRLPSQRGFNNIFRKEYLGVSLERLKDFQPGAVVTPEGLKERNIIKSLKKPVKILGDGELKKPLVVRAHGFTQTARDKIQAAGGQAEIITNE